MSDASIRDALRRLAAWPDGDPLPIDTETAQALMRRVRAHLAAPEGIEAGVPPDTGGTSSHGPSKEEARFLRRRAAAVVCPRTGCPASVDEPCRSMAGGNVLSLPHGARLDLLDDPGVRLVQCRIRGRARDRWSYPPPA